MNWADWIVVVIIVLSSLLSLKRGFVKEAISLAIWALAFFVAVAFHERLAVLFEEMVKSVSLRYVLSYTLLFAATFVVGSMVKYLVGELVRMTGLSGTDRLFGMAFGITRGVIVVMALLIFVPMLMPVNQEPWWTESVLIPQFLLIEHWCRDAFSLIVELVSSITQRW